MKSHRHKLLQITTIAIIVFAAYVSFKQVDGFQTTPPAQIPNSATLDALISSLPDTSSGSMPAWLTIDNRFQKGTLLKSNMNKTYLEHTNLIHTKFTESKAGGDKDDITLDKLYTLTYNNYIPKSTTLDELKSVTRDILAPMPGPPPTWMVNIISKMNLLNDTVTRKMEGKEPSAEVSAKLDKIQSDIFTASKTTQERDDATFNKVLDEQIKYINNYSLITNSATLQALFNVINPDPKPAWFTTERANALKKVGDLSREKGIGHDNKGYQDAINKAFTDSKAAGDKDDVTFDKVIKAGTDYLNNGGSSNLPLYIGAGVGGVAVLGTISYLMFFR